MDSSVQLTTAPPSKNGENSMTVLSEREKFISTYIRNQLCSLPDSVIYYISKNPSNSKVYEKLIQSCKYFFIKNSLLVVKNLNFLYDKNQWNIFSLNRKNVDLNCVSSKFWITDRLRIVSFNSILLSQNSLTTVLTKIYQSDVKELIIRNQKIYITDLDFLASKCKKIDLDRIIVINEVDTIVGLEKIIEVLPKIQKFLYRLSQNLGTASQNVIKPETVKKLIQISHFSNIKFLSLSEIPETFDIDTLYDYIKKNKRTRFCLIFRDQLTQQYQNRLQTIVNEIIATRNRDYKVPLIYFSEINFSSIDTLLKLF